MKESSDGFVRADQIDLKSLDEQLERHLTRVLTLEKSKIMRDSETNSNSIHHPRHVHFLHDPLHPKMPPPEVGDRPLQAPHQVCHYSWHLRHRSPWHLARLWRRNSLELD
ncbi:hypothetical protein DVH24_004590 [Malus domestica]|uniref:Uncharacterized protein n=1 Tax=Malus domestica TaxID=3750 RepID=A0A498IB50_MALDO|nr:hypothetical protein DVH24_004590 [Malus domestica]